MSQEKLPDSSDFRCQMEFYPRQFENLYLMFCGCERHSAASYFGPIRRSGYHLHVVLSGEGVLEVDGRCSRVREGHLFLEKPNELTYYRADVQNPWTYCWMTFDGTSASHFVEQAGFTEGVNVLRSYVDPYEFYKLIEQSLKNNDCTLSGSMLRNGLLNQYVGLAIESRLRCEPQQTAGQNLMERRGEIYVDHALDYIHNNYASIKVADVARYLGLSRCYCSNLFKTRMGMSICDYLMTLRMKKSAQLLRETSLSVQDISEAVGYDSSLTFSRAFKKAYGISPIYYRAQSDRERTVLECPCRHGKGIGTGAENFAYPKELCRI